MTTATVEFAAPYPGLRPFLPGEAPLFFGLLFRNSVGTIVDAAG